ncbi:hypothetical protein ILUMI_02065 [Ignelater luminosus]|uniref:Uncharacterized protein n=1 Tax=Ignelater luminosus TaxID=2038154 RepID=A0A8K0DIE4_IGNLU|nr:hypothetical protein ILUMI_02065 [Ignelater luminosus]
MERGRHSREVADCYIYAVVQVLRNKVPEIERGFLIDQRTSRKMIIGGVDVKSTLKLQKAKERKEREAEKLKGH